MITVLWSCRNRTWHVLNVFLPRETLSSTVMELDEKWPKKQRTVVSWYRNLCGFNFRFFVKAVALLAFSAIVTDFVFAAFLLLFKGRGPSDVLVYRLSVTRDKFVIFQSNGSEWTHCRYLSCLVLTSHWSLSISAFEHDSIELQTIVLSD